MELEKVTFTLENDPQLYTMVYDFNRVCDAEEMLKENLFHAISNPVTMTANQCRGLVFAFLLTAHPKVLVSEAGDLLSRDSNVVTKALGKMLGASEAEPEVKKTPEVKTTTEPPQAE